ncbi:MAG: hypothetical protein U9Q22_02415, partial [Candidatus Altiarchaeota archaeon]|nr:hypothetical protein [Candidatus Altiarchaeota archaeon]
MDKEKNFMWAAGLMILLFLMINANAISDRKLADDNYKEAKEAYNAGDCVDASELAGRALTLYTKVNYDEGRLKTLNLIGKINTCLMKNGDSHYQKALDKFNERYYLKCVIWAGWAKARYSLIPYPLGVSKCVELIVDAEKEINETKIGDANELYETAMDFYDSEDMPHAKVKAKEALEMYTGIDYTEGINDCNALLSEIDDWITKKTLEAETKYGYAEDHYKKAVKNKGFLEYNTALEYAKEAKTLFDKLGDIGGYRKSRDFINIINSDVEDLEDDFNTEADSHYDEGVKEFLYGVGAKEKNMRKKHFNKAKSEIEQARPIYALLYDWAASLGDLSMKEKKKKLYKDKIRKCDDKLKDIEGKLREMRFHEEAERLYLEANAFFILGYCRNATGSVGNASSLFKEIGDYSGISKCDTLMGQINGCLVKLDSADKYYAEADTYLREMDFENANSSLQKARAKYDEINYRAGVKECALLNKEIGEVVKRKKAADELLSEADMLYGQKDYVGSNESAWKARVICEGLGYDGGLSAADSLIGRNGEAMEEIRRRNQLITMIAIGVLLAAILITIAIWWIRRTRGDRVEDELMGRERKRLEDELIRKT